MVYVLDGGMWDRILIIAWSEQPWTTYARPEMSLNRLVLVFLTHASFSARIIDGFGMTETCSSRLLGSGTEKKLGRLLSKYSMQSCKLSTGSLSAFHMPTEGSIGGDLMMSKNRISDLAAKPSIKPTIHEFPGRRFRRPERMSEFEMTMLRLS